MGLSKNDLLLNSNKGKNAINKFINIVMHVFILLSFILNSLIKYVLEKNKEKAEVNISIKNHINTLMFSIEFTKSIIFILLSTI